MEYFAYAQTVYTRPLLGKVGGVGKVAGNEASTDPLSKITFTAFCNT